MPTLADHIAASAQHNSLYHFTDTRNLSSIRQHGLLSVHLLAARGLIPAAPGGNTWSRDADKRVGMDRYVHLCLLPEHPMEWTARNDGRIVKSAFIKVSPKVLDLPGVLFTDRVANESGVTARPIADAAQSLDLEVVYQKTDWKDSAIQERRKVAKKYEILIPDHVAVQYLTF